MLESVDSEYRGRVALVRVDAAVDPDAARALGTFAVPLLVALRDGREQARKLGAATAADVRAVFEAALGNAPITRPGVSRTERALRLLAGTGLVAIGLATGPRWVLVGLGVALLFLAVHDRLRHAVAGFNYVDPRGPRYAGAWQGAPTAPPDPSRLRVVSFNIKLARDIDGALEALRRPELAGADILLLQEMDLAGTERLSCALGRNFVYYPAALHPSTGRPLRPFGVAVLSPWPIADDRKLPLSPVSRRDAARKTAMAATVAVAGRPVRVVNVHLQVRLSTKDFLLQLDEALVGVAGAGSPEFPLIVAGDFNSNSTALLDELAARARSRGLTSALPRGVGTVAVGPVALWQLDHILFAGLEPAGAGAALRGPRKGSDHFPIRADLNFQGPPDRAPKPPPETALPPLFCGEPIR